jgi:prepilin-type processing-associated H-X9-DG protein
VIGYNYLAGHARVGAANGWVSPLRARDPGILPVAADLNDWSPQDSWTVVPHPHSGRGEGLVYDKGLPPTVYGAEGGNVAYLDGSVKWVPISAMRAYGTYNGSALAYQGMW